MSDTVEILADEFKLGYPLTYDIIYNRGRAEGRADALDEFINWLKEKGIHGSKEFTRIIHMYEDEFKEQKNEQS